MILDGPMYLAAGRYRARCIRSYGRNDGGAAYVVDKGSGVLAALTIGGTLPTMLFTIVEPTEARLTLERGVDAVVDIERLG